MTIDYSPYFPLYTGSKDESQISRLQTILKRFGYYDSRIDGKFAAGTKRAVQAFQVDADIVPSGYINKDTAEFLAALLLDKTRWVIPIRSEVDAPSDQISLFLHTMRAKGIPLAFAKALAEQEGNLNHFDSDGFVKLRCEFFADSHLEGKVGCQIRYRSYGMLQILDLGHPEDEYTRGDEVGGLTNRELKYSVAKNIEAGAYLLKSLLRGKKECLFTQDDRRWYDCKACLSKIPKVSQDWTRTKWHRWKCAAMPDLEKIPCSWPEAIRRYNGSGIEAFAYRDEILTRIVNAKRIYKVVEIKNSEPFNVK
jgi:hypothetical protein